MLVVDTTQATAANRVKYYVNGVQITAFSTTDYPTQNSTTTINSAVAHNLGAYTSSTQYFDGYMAEVNFIDGQALTPSSFGTTNALTGAWIPMPYTGTYGTNGFYLNFKDNTSTTTLGYDYSGNANNWTANNISLTAGTTYDSMLDVPTSWVGYNTGDTTAVTRGNYAVFNPLNGGMAAAPQNGNLYFTPTLTSNNWYPAVSTIPAASSFYAEFTIGTVPTYWTFCISLSSVIDLTGVTMPGLQAGAGGFSAYQAYNSGGNTYVTFNNTTPYTFAGTNWATSDVFMLAFDYTTGRVYFGRNGTWYNSGSPVIGAGTGYVATLATTSTLYPSVGLSGTGGMYANFGQRPFSYTPPTGFKTLCVTNLPAPTVSNGASYMAATLYTGNAGSITVNNGTNNTTSTTFQPDFVWVKARSSAYDHKLVDSVRGASGGIYYELDSNTTGAESLPGAGVNGLTSTGFTIGGGTNNGYNGNGTTFVGWQWKANGSAVSNTAGSITSQVNANTTAGFSVVTYSGTGAAATVGHGLGAAPKMIILKSRNAVHNWQVYNANLTSAAYYLLLNTTAAQASSSTSWNSTAPTSTVFSVGTDNSASGETFVAYCWSEIAGYSKFGSYTGNGSADGPFVYCGFRPRFILWKKTTGVAADWDIIDTSRNVGNIANSPLYPNASSAETAVDKADILSNGFKLRTTSTDSNVSGETYIFAAFAENPFNYSNAR